MFDLTGLSSSYTWTPCICLFSIVWRRRYGRSIIPCKFVPPFVPLTHFVHCSLKIHFTFLSLSFKPVNKGKQSKELYIAGAARTERLVSLDQRNMETQINLCLKSFAGIRGSMIIWTQICTCVVMSPCTWFPVVRPAVHGQSRRWDVPLCEATLGRLLSEMHSVPGWFLRTTKLYK